MQRSLCYDAVMPQAARPPMTPEDVARFDEEVAAEPDIFDQFAEDHEAEVAADAEAKADIAAGRVVPHAEVAAWLRKWGTDEETAMPDEWLR